MGSLNRHCSTLTIRLGHMLSRQCILRLFVGIIAEGFLQSCEHMLENIDNENAFVSCRHLASGTLINTVSDNVKAEFLHPSQSLDNTVSSALGAATVVTCSVVLCLRILRNKSFRILRMKTAS